MYFFTSLLVYFRCSNQSGGLWSASCKSETEPAIADEDSINEDSEYDKKHWNVNNEEILIDFTQDDNLHKDQDQR